MSKCIFSKKEAICLNHNLEKVQKYTLENMVDIGSHLVETFYSKYL